MIAESLKDAMRADLDVFINLREFASLHVLEGVILACAVRTYTGALSVRMSEDFDAIHGQTLRLEFRAEDLLRKADHLPREKERVRFDKKYYTVTRAENEFGIVRLTLTSQRGARG